MVVGQLELQMYASMARLQSDMDNAKRTVGGAVNKINNILGAIGAGISVDFMLGLAQKSNEYNKSLAALSTQISGATNQIKELDAASRKLSVQFGTDALKQSTAFYEILSAGITDTTQATALLTEANRLAIGGNADLMISVDGLTSIIKGYGNAAGTASEIADTLFTASLAGKVSIQELSENIGKVIPLATTMGISLEEVTSGISALTLGGISAKESITGVRAILATVAKPSAEAARLAKEIGLEFNTAGIQAMGFAGFLEEVKTKTQGSADKMAVLFGGVESLIPALALTGNAGIEFNNIIGQMANKAGAAENAFNKMAASPGFQWDKFMSTMSNIAITLGDALANVLTPAAEMAAKALNKLFGFNNVTGIEKQVQLINELTDKVESMSNRRHIPLVGGLLFDKKEFDLLEHQLEMAKADLADMQKAQQAATSVQKQATVEIAHNAAELAKNNETKEKSVQISTRLGNAFNSELYLLRQYESEAKRARDITASVATEQEQYNQKLEELDRLKPYLSVETYNRALQKAQEELNKTSTVTRSTTDQVSQLWIQAGRNIQSSLANSIFDFFNGGLDSMVQNVKNTVLRIASEFAAMKIADMIGLNQMFSATGTSSGGSSTIGMLTSLAGMFSGARGAGVNTSTSAGVFGGGSSAGTAFIGGPGTAIGGTTSGRSGLGMNSGSLMALGSAAGPYGMAAAAAFMVLKELEKNYGDYKLKGGAKFTLGAYETFSPVAYVVKGLGLQTPEALIGKFLFGRGPYKFRQQSLQGNIASGGLDGTITDVYRSKGAVFTGNRHQSFTDDIPSEIIRDVDKTIKSIYKSTHEFALNLGMDANLVDTFTKEVQVKSEKGKTLTTEAVGEMLSGLNDEIVARVMPDIDSFKLTGETAGETFTRLNSEFEALVSASAVLGVSLNTARTVLRASTIDGRSAFIDAAGGIDALNSKAQYFAANFLDGSEIVQRNAELLTEQMGELGLSTDMTKEDFKNLVQSFGHVNGVSEEMLIALLDIAPLFNEVKTAADATGTSIGDLANQLTLSKDEMVAVGTVMANVGYSFNDILQVLREVPADQINAFVNSVGGIDALLSSSGSFAQNFLTGAELAQTKADYLAKQFTDLGIRSDLTAQDFKDLVQGVGEFAGTSLETRAAAAGLTDEFVELYGGANDLAGAVSGLVTYIDNLTHKLTLTNQSAVQVGTVLGNVGYSFDEIMQVLRDLPAEEITAFVNKLGGIDALLSSSSVFAQNFLTEAELMQTKSDYLAKRLTDLGIRTDLTAQDFKDLVQGVGEFAGVSKETRGFVELLSKDFVELYGGTNKAAEGTDNLTDAVGGLNTVAPGAVASIQQLVTAGLNFGFTMQQVSQMIGASTQEQLNAAITNAGGIDKVTQDSNFIKANFMSPEQALAVDMQDLANQLVTVGASTQTTRAEFLKLIQTAQVGSQRFNDLNAIAPLFDSVYDRIETAAQAAANYVPPQPTIINQAQIDAANSALQTAESNLANARQQLASARQQEAGQVQQDIDRFKQLAKTLRDASKALSLSDLSPLTPGEKYNEAARQLNSLQAAAMRGDQEAMSQLPDAARSFLEASKLYQGQSTTAYQADFSKVQALLDTTAGKAETQLSVAQKQLDALGQINSSTLSVAQAVRDLASAQSAYDAAKSSIPDAIYSTPDTNAPIVPTMPTSGTLLTDINTSSSNVLAFPSDTQILDFVGSHWGDWKGIYDEAQKYKVSSARLASVTAGTQYQLAQSDISAWVQSQGLPAFERGTDMVRRGGLAVLHPAEAVTPANHMLDMAREIRELRREVAELRKDSNRNSTEARRVYIESNRENAIMINDGAKASSKTENWNNRLRRSANAG